jgi:hypothetical protein
MKVNGKEYKTPSLNFSAMEKMEGWGLNIDEIGDKPLRFVAAFVALAMDCDIPAASAEIDAHMENGGKLDDITALLHDAIANSGFFKAGTTEE